VSDNHIDADLAVEVFILEPAAGAGDEDAEHQAGWPAPG
jgi:hypothetical protein